MISPNNLINYIYLLISRSVTSLDLPMDQEKNELASSCAPNCSLVSRNSV